MYSCSWLKLKKMEKAGDRVASASCQHRDPPAVSEVPQHPRATVPGKLQQMGNICGMEKKSVDFMDFVSFELTKMKLLNSIPIAELHKQQEWRFLHQKQQHGFHKESSSR